MYLRHVYYCLIIFLSVGIVYPKFVPKKQTYNEFTELYSAAKKQLTPKSKGAKEMKTILKASDLSEILALYSDYIHQKTGNWRNPSLWLDGVTPITLFKTTKDDVFSYDFDTYEPFVEKRILPINSRVAVHGDLHGGFFELLEFIKYHIDNGDIDTAYKIISDDFYLLFLGDYTDRGIYGAEVVYTLLCLKLANPERVFLVRGNHEDPRITSHYGFQKECLEKFGDIEGEQLYRAIHYMYESFPVALFLGSGNPEHYYYFLVCHGGLEIGFDPKKLLEDVRLYSAVLLDELLRADALEHISSNIRKHLNSSEFKNLRLSDYGTKLFSKIGFMWNDFFVDDVDIFAEVMDRGFKFGLSITQEILDLYEIVGVLRAHQHGDCEMMKSIKKWKGISRLWSNGKSSYDLQRGLWRGIVCTFTVAPDAGYGATYGIDYDAFGILILGKTFDACSLQTFQIFEQELYSNNPIKTEYTFPLVLALGAKISRVLVKILFDFNNETMVKKNEYVAVPLTDGYYTLGKVVSVSADNSDVKVSWMENGQQFEKEIARNQLGVFKSEYEVRKKERKGK